MRKFFAILIIVTCCSHLVQAQERLAIDSLLRQLPLLKDTARIDCLNRLGFEYSNPYWNQSHRVQTDTAVYFTLQAQTEARRLRYICGIGAAYQNLGMVAEQRGRTAEDVLTEWRDDHAAGIERAKEALEVTQAALDEVTGAQAKK